MASLTSRAVLPTAALLAMIPAASLGGRPLVASMADRVIERAFADLQQPSSSAEITIEDLLTLRDIGGMALSPDGKRLAFSVRQADLSQDSYRVKWFVVRLDGRGRGTEIQIDGGQPITRKIRGLPDGFIPSEQPLWASDGSAIAFRRQQNDRIGLWMADADTGHAAQVYDGPAQVIDFAWSESKELIFRTGFDPVRFEQLVSEEGRRGWLLDGRMELWAARTPSPAPPACSPSDRNPPCTGNAYVVVPGQPFRPTTQEESDRLERSKSSHSQISAWIEPAPGASASAALPLKRITASSSLARACTANECYGQLLSAVGLARNAQSVWFTKRPNPLDSSPGALATTLLFEWRLQPDEVRRVVASDADLSECEAHEAHLYCIREAPSRPAHIVDIDLDDGSIIEVLDPNRTWRAKHFPRIDTVGLDSPAGWKGFARLVYPAHYEHGQRYPLVIVQYRSRRFLRGGTGDEYPIFPFAYQGYFVLSVDEPTDFEGGQRLREAEVIRGNAHRREEQAVAAIEAAVDRLVAARLVDPALIAITGLSAGAENVHYASQRSGRYAVAIASQGRRDLTFAAQAPAGEVRSRIMSSYRQDGVTAGPGSMLAERVWSQQPQMLRTPLLLNVGQYEALFGFEGFAALMYAARPLEVRIFPDEGHIKFRPAHRLGVYRNNVQWLNFWLKGAVERHGPDAAQFERWIVMRDRLAAERAQ